MKVFLSHSTLDKEFTLRLNDALRAEHIETWICEKDIDHGDNFVAEIHQALRNCDLYLLVWSAEAAASKWTREEWTVARKREVEESRTLLCVVRLREHPVDGLLATKDYIDAWKDQEAGVRQAVAWVNRRRAIRSAGSGRGGRLLMTYDPSGFAGRAWYLDRLYGALVEREGVFLLHGQPGAGKSTLAMQFGYQFQGSFDTVVLQHCGQRGLAEIGVELASKLKLGVESQAPERQIDAAMEWLRERRALLILDDVWDTEMKALCPGAPVSVLVTSRRRSFGWVAPANTEEVPPFSETEAESVFRAYLGEEVLARHEADLRKLAHRLDRLPIAVVVAADLLKRKIEPPGPAAARVQVTDLVNDVHNVPDLLRRAVESQPEREGRLLEAMAACAAEEFWLPLAVRIADLSETEGDGARDSLVQASLVRAVDVERQRFRLHALLREQLLAGKGPALVERHARELESLFGNWEVRWKECRECFGEVPGAMAWLIGVGGKDRMASLAGRASRAAFRTGEPEWSLRFLREEQPAWESQDEMAAAGHLQRIYGNQALILQAWGRLDEAMALLERVKALCVDVGNKDYLERTYGNQALILKAWGRLDEAMALHKKEEALCDELGNKDGLQRSDGNQALILQDWGRLEEAMALHQKQEMLCDELGNKDGLQRSYGNQGLILKDWGRLEEAMALHKRQEALCVELGNKDSLQRSYGNQAVILRPWGRLEEAMALLKKQEALCIELGARAGLGYCYWNWGLVARQQGDHRVAEEKLRAALRIFTELKMPRERDAVQRALGDAAASGE